MNLAFSGGGFLSVYQLGVAAGFVEYAPDIIKNLNSASGASGGAITASALVVCPDKLPELSRYCIEMGVKTRDFYTGAFHPRVSIPHLIEEALDRVFPDNAHQLANNKVHISLTRARDRQNILISEFFSKMDLIKCVACSCFVPFWSGIVPPFYRGERYLDGGISDNHPIPFDIQKTITISPFVGDGMICPNHVSRHDFENSDICIRRTIKFTLGDLHRATRALFSPDEASLRALCQQGFEDALEYLRKHHYSTCITSNLLQPLYENDRIITQSEDIAGDLAKKIGHDEYEGLMETLKSAMAETNKWLADNDNSALVIDLELLKTCIKEARQRNLHLLIRNIILRPCVNAIETIIAIMLRIFSISHEFYCSVVHLLGILKQQFGDLFDAARYYSDHNIRYLEEYDLEHFHCLLKLGALTEVICRKKMSRKLEDWHHPDRNREHYQTLRSAANAFTSAVGISIAVGRLTPSNIPFAQDSDTMITSLIDTIELMDIGLMVYLAHEKTENDKIDWPDVSLWFKREYSNDPNDKKDMTEKDN